MKRYLICLLAFIHPMVSSSQSNLCKLKIITDKLANTKIAYTPVWQVTNGVNKMDLHFYKTGHSIIFSVVVTTAQMVCVEPEVTAGMALTVMFEVFVVPVVIGLELTTRIL